MVGNKTSLFIIDCRKSSHLIFLLIFKKNSLSNEFQCHFDSIVSICIWAPWIKIDVNQWADQSILNKLTDVNRFGAATARKHIVSELTVEITAIQHSLFIVSHWPLLANLLNNVNSSIYMIIHVTINTMTFFHFLLLSKKKVTSKDATKIFMDH